MDVVFPFGAQYLRGLTPHPEDWERDMVQMRSLGFTHIRAWLVWGILEPRPGEIDVGSVVRLLDLAQGHGLRVVLLFHLHGCPEWAVRTQRECWYVDQRGRPFEPQARSNTPSGGWPGLCPDHPNAAALEAKFIKAVVTRVGRHPALAGWEPMNEPHMWLDPEPAPPGLFCYCEATRAAFRAWLMERYATLDGLAKAWGRRFSAWDDVRPPAWRFGYADWCDWRTFTAASICGHVRRRAEIIRAHSLAPILAHAWGGGTTQCIQLGAMAFDDWRQAEAVDVWGCSSFPARLEQVVEIGISMDSTRAAAGGKPFWQAELGAGDRGGGLERHGRVPPAWLTLWSWEALRHGAKGLLYWQFRKERQGSELGAYGLAGYAGEATENAHAAAAVGRVLQRYAAHFLASQPEPARVAIVFSWQSYLVDWAEHRTCQMSRAALAGYYHILWRRNIPVDIVHDERLTAEKLARYRLLILPTPTALAPATSVLLGDYVREGGHVLADPYLCALTPDKELDDCVPGRGLAGLFGCRELDVRRAEPEVRLLFPDRREGVIRGSHLRASWSLMGEVDVVLRYADGAPAIISHARGAGRAISSGVSLGMGAALEDRAGDAGRGDLAGDALGDAAEIVLGLVAEAGVKPPLEAPDSVRASLLQRPDGGAILIAMNLAAAPVRDTIGLQGRRFVRAVRVDGTAEHEVPLSAGALPVDMPALGVGVYLLEQ
jgi:beta-galactosidase GanA